MHIFATMYSAKLSAAISGCYTCTAKNNSMKFVQQKRCILLNFLEEIAYNLENADNKFFCYVCAFITNCKLYITEYFSQIVKSAGCATYSYI